MANKKPTKMQVAVHKADSMIMDRLLIAHTRMDVRTARLKKLYTINAPQPIIDKELELIAKAGEEMRQINITIRKVNVALGKVISKTDKIINKYKNNHEKTFWRLHRQTTRADEHRGTCVHH